MKAKCMDTEKQSELFWQKGFKRFRRIFLKYNTGKTACEKAGPLTMKNHEINGLINDGIILSKKLLRIWPWELCYQFFVVLECFLVLKKL